MTPFLAADPKGAMVLLKLGADPQVTDKQKRNRWHYLNLDGWEGLVKKLAILRVDVNQQDAEGRSPLLCCILGGQFKQAMFLAEHGADLALADNNGTTPLQVHRHTLPNDEKGQHDPGYSRPEHQMTGAPAGYLIELMQK